MKLFKMDFFCLFPVWVFQSIFSTHSICKINKIIDKTVVFHEGLGRYSQLGFLFRHIW